MKNLLKVLAWILGAALAIGMFTGLALLSGWLVSLLWNYALVPQGAAPMDAWQGLALHLLAQVLFGNIKTPQLTSKKEANGA